jgi:hypothetical protein
MSTGLLRAVCLIAGGLFVLSSRSVYRRRRRVRRSDRPLVRRHVHLRFLAQPTGRYVNQRQDPEARSQIANRGRERKRLARDSEMEARKAG